MSIASDKFFKIPFDVTSRNQRSLTGQKFNSTSKLKETKRYDSIPKSNIKSNIKSYVQGLNENDKFYAKITQEILKNNIFPCCWEKHQIKIHLTL